MVDRSKVEDILSDQLAVLQNIESITSAPHTEILFTEVIYVDGNNGDDNNDGLSWDTPLQTINQAYENADANAHVLIIIGGGIYDVNVAGAFVVNKHVHIAGVERHLVEVFNNHALATGVFQFTLDASLSNLDVNCGTGTNYGVRFSLGSSDSHLDGVGVGATQVTGAQSCVIIDNLVFTIHINKSIITGHWQKTRTTGIYCSGRACRIEGTRIASCLIGIQFTATSLGCTVNDNCKVYSCATGVQIDNGAGTIRLTDMYLWRNTVNIVDNGGVATVILQDIRATGIETSIVPANLTGIALTAGIGANTYGADVEIRSIAAATRPFYVTGIVFEPDTLEKWCVRLSDDGGVTYFWEGIVESTANRSNRVIFAEAHTHSPVNQGVAIVGSVKSETGGNVLDLWISIEAI